MKIFDLGKATIKVVGKQKPEELFDRIPGVVYLGGMGEQQLDEYLTTNVFLPILDKHGHIERAHQINPLGALVAAAEPDPVTRHEEYMKILELDDGEEDYDSY